MSILEERSVVKSDEAMVGLIVIGLGSVGAESVCIGFADVLKYEEILKVN